MSSSACITGDVRLNLMRLLAAGFALVFVFTAACAPKEKAMSTEEKERLVIVPMPSLVATLLRKEEDKGSPLTEDEVNAIRDKAPAVAVPVSKVSAIEESRGYKDIDPDHAWAEWRRVRVELKKETEANKTPEGTP